MKREALLKAIEEGKEFEENIIPRLGEFYSKEVDWAGLPKRKADKLKEILRTLIEDSKNHRRKLDGLSKHIREAHGNEC